MLKMGQHAPLVPEHAVSTYVISTDYLRKASGLFEGKVIPYVMPRERCVDIDRETDFKIARLQKPSSQLVQPVCLVQPTSEERLRQAHVYLQSTWKGSARMC